MGARFQMNRGGVGALLRSAQAQRAVAAAAAELAGRAGEGFGVHTSTTSRARAYVRPETAAARRRNYRERVLERISAGG